MIISTALAALIVLTVLVLGWENGKRPSKSLTKREVEEYLADQEDRAI